MIPEAPSKIKPITTFLISFLPCSYHQALAQLDAIITPQAITIIKLETKISDKRILDIAFIKSGNAVS